MVVGIIAQGAPKPVFGRLYLVGNHSHHAAPVAPVTFGSIDNALNTHDIPDLTDKQLPGICSAA